MNPPKLNLVPEGTRWPSGDGVDLAALPLSADELAQRLGLPLVKGIEDGLGAWAGIGGQLSSGQSVEFICYAHIPRQVMLRVDKNAPYSATLDEALQLVKLSREDVRVNPIANS